MKPELIAIALAILVCIGVGGSVGAGLAWWDLHLKPRAPQPVEMTIHCWPADR